MTKGYKQYIRLFITEINILDLFDHLIYYLYYCTLHSYLTELV